MSQHHYGGETYPANIVIVNPATVPDNTYEPLAAFYDFNNTWVTANDIETIQTSLPTGESVILLNPDTQAITMVTSDGLKIYPQHRFGFMHLWRKRAVLTSLEPEQRSLLVHERDHLGETPR